MQRLGPEHFHVFDFSLFSPKFQFPHGDMDRCSSMVPDFCIRFQEGTIGVQIRSKSKTVCAHSVSLTVTPYNSATSRNTAFGHR